MRAPKLSVLVFAVEEPERVLEAAKHVYEIADQVVVIYSGFPEQFRKLQDEKKKRKLRKLDAFYAVALGYAEPLRTYGISKCRNEWILLLDLDERLSDALKKGIRQLMADADFDVLQIKRYENVSMSGQRSEYFTWQVRLFKKGSLEYLGLTHESPKTFGRVKNLNLQNYHMNHVNELKHVRYYNEMDLFSNTNIAVLILRDIFLGMKLGEVNDIDYITNIIDTHRNFKKRQTQEIKRIGRIIQEQGIIRYLSLDREETIKKLNKKYANGEQGIALLIKLLNDRYNDRYP